MKDRNISDRTINFRYYIMDQRLADFTVKGREWQDQEFLQRFDMNSQNCNVKAGKPELTKEIERF